MIIAATSNLADLCSSSCSLRVSSVCDSMSVESSLDWLSHCCLRVDFSISRARRLAWNSVICLFCSRVIWSDSSPLFSRRPRNSSNSVSKDFTYECKICCYRFNYFHSIGNFSKLLHYFFYFIIVRDDYIEHLGAKIHYFCYSYYTIVFLFQKYNLAVLNTGTWHIMHKPATNLLT